MKPSIYEVTIAFKGIKCNVQIIPDEFDCYELSVKSTRPLSTEDRSVLRSYLHQEGYIDEAFKAYQS